MIEPLLSDDAFLADVAAAPRSRELLHLWWLGQSGFLVQWNGRHLLLDPYLSDSLTRKYASTDKPHVRMTRRVIDPGRLDFVDVVTSSHNHTDHLDAETLSLLSRANPQLRMVAPTANLEFIRNRLGASTPPIVGLTDGESQVVGPFGFTGIPAAHESRETDALGRDVYLGYVVQCGRWTLYHSGDTLLYDGMIDKLRPFHIDVAMLPINGRSFERRVAGNLSGAEAAQLAHQIGAGVAIPCHYEMFEFNTANPPPFVAECERLGQRAIVLRAGQRLTLP